MQTEDTAIDDIKVNGQESVIRIEWRWGTSRVKKLKILYKIQDGPEGNGSPFTEWPVVRLPDSEYGSAEKDLLNERGLYVFTFIPIYEKGEEGTICKKENVMLGRKITIYLSWREMKEGICVRFYGFGMNLPEEAVEYLIGGLRYKLFHPIYDGFEALFPGIYDRAEVSLIFSEDYCQMYEFQ